MAVGEVDSAKDRYDHDVVDQIMAATETPGQPISRIQWILFQRLANRGARWERAVHEIAALAPRRP